MKQSDNRREPDLETLSQRQQKLEREMRELQNDIAHWNAAHPDEEPIYLSSDLTVDVEQRRAVTAPHYYVGQGVDIGVGEQMEPCHTCGRQDYDPIHHVSRKSDIPETAVGGEGYF